MLLYRRCVHGHGRLKIGRSAFAAGRPGRRTVMKASTQVAWSLAYSICSSTVPLARVFDWSNEMITSGFLGQWPSLFGPRRLDTPLRLVSSLGQIAWSPVGGGPFLAQPSEDMHILTLAIVRQIERHDDVDVGLGDAGPVGDADDELLDVSQLVDDDRLVCPIVTPSGSDVTVRLTVLDGRR